MPLPVLNGNSTNSEYLSILPRLESQLIVFSSTQIGTTNTDDDLNVTYISWSVIWYTGLMCLTSCKQINKKLHEAMLKNCLHPQINIKLKSLLLEQKLNGLNGCVFIIIILQVFLHQHGFLVCNRDLNC